MASFLVVFPPKPCVYSWSLQCMLHFLSITIILIVFGGE
jgi:hypothetical protein